jgi:hypothetical protein
VGVHDSGLIVQRDLSQLLRGADGFLEVLPLPPVGFGSIVLLDRDWLYFADDALMRVPWDGGDAELVATLDELREDPTTTDKVLDAVTDDDEFIYYGENVRYVHRLSKTGGDVSLLLDIADLLGSERLPQPYSMVNDAGNVYVSFNNQNGSETGAIVRIEKATGTAQVLALDPHNPLALALDDTHVYWTRNVRNRFADIGPGAVVRVRKDGTALEVVAERQNGPVSLAVTPEYVYWENTVTSELRRLKLPR